MWQALTGGGDGGGVKCLHTLTLAHSCARFPYPPERASDVCHTFTATAWSTFFRLTAPLRDGAATAVAVRTLFATLRTETSRKHPAEQALRQAVIAFAVRQGLVEGASAASQGSVAEAVAQIVGDPRATSPELCAALPLLARLSAALGRAFAPTTRMLAGAVRALCEHADGRVRAHAADALRAFVTACPAEADGIRADALVAAQQAVAAADAAAGGSNGGASSSSSSAEASGDAECAFSWDRAARALHGRLLCLAGLARGARAAPGNVPRRFLEQAHEVAMGACALPRHLVGTPGDGAAWPCPATDARAAQAAAAAAGGWSLVAALCVHGPEWVAYRLPSLLAAWTQAARDCKAALHATSRSAPPATPGAGSARDEETVLPLLALSAAARALHAATRHARDAVLAEDSGAGPGGAAVAASVFPTGSGPDSAPPRGRALCTLLGSMLEVFGGAGRSRIVAAREARVSGVAAVCGAFAALPTALLAHAQGGGAHAKALLKQCLRQSAKGPSVPSSLLIDALGSSWLPIALAHTEVSPRRGPQRAAEGFSAAARDLFSVRLSTATEVERSLHTDAVLCRAAPLLRAGAQASGGPGADDDADALRRAQRVASGCVLAHAGEATGPAAVPLGSRVLQVAAPSPTLALAPRSSARGGEAGRGTEGGGGENQEGEEDMEGGPPTGSAHPDSLPLAVPGTEGTHAVSVAASTSGRAVDCAVLALGRLLPLQKRRVQQNVMAHLSAEVDKALAAEAAAAAGDGGPAPKSASPSGLLTNAVASLLTAAHATAEVVGSRLEAGLGASGAPSKQGAASGGGMDWLAGPAFASWHPDEPAAWVESARTLLLRCLGARDVRVRHGAGGALAALCTLHGSAFARGVCKDLEGKAAAANSTASAQGSDASPTAGVGKGASVGAGTLHTAAGAVVALACIRRAMGADAAPVSDSTLYKLCRETRQPLRAAALAAWAAVIESAPSRAARYLKSALAIAEAHVLTDEGEGAAREALGSDNDAEVTPTAGVGSSPSGATGTGAQAWAAAFHAGDAARRSSWTLCVARLVHAAAALAGPELALDAVLACRVFALSSHVLATAGGGGGAETGAPLAGIPASALGVPTGRWHADGSAAAAAAALYPPTATTGGQSAAPGGAQVVALATAAVVQLLRVGATSLGVGGVLPAAALPAAGTVSGIGTGPSSFLAARAAQLLLCDLPVIAPRLAELVLPCKAVAALLVAPSALYRTQTLAYLGKGDGGAPPPPHSAVLCAAPATPACAVARCAVEAGRQLAARGFIHPRRAGGAWIRCLLRVFDRALAGAAGPATRILGAPPEVLLSLDGFSGGIGAQARTDGGAGAASLALASLAGVGRRVGGVTARAGAREAVDALLAGENAAGGAGTGLAAGASHALLVPLWSMPQAVAPPPRPVLLPRAIGSGSDAQCTEDGAAALGSALAVRTAGADACVGVDAVALAGETLCALQELVARDEEETEGDVAPWAACARHALRAGAGEDRSGAGAAAGRGPPRGEGGGDASGLTAALSDLLTRNDLDTDEEEADEEEAEEEAAAGAGPTAGNGAAAAGAASSGDEDSGGEEGDEEGGIGAMPAGGGDAGGAMEKGGAWSRPGYAVGGWRWQTQLVALQACEAALARAAPRRDAAPALFDLATARQRAEQAVEALRTVRGESAAAAAAAKRKQKRAASRKHKTRAAGGPATEAEAAAAVEKAESALVLHLEGLIRLATAAASAGAGGPAEGGIASPTAVAGTRLMRLLVTLFGPVDDPDLPGSSLLEQYETQLFSCLHQALRSGVGPASAAQGFALACDILLFGVSREAGSVADAAGHILAPAAKEGEGEGEGAVAGASPALDRLHTRLARVAASARMALAVAAADGGDTRGAPAGLLAMGASHTGAATPFQKPALRGGARKALRQALRDASATLPALWAACARDSALLARPAPVLADAGPEGGTALVARDVGPSPDSAADALPAVAEVAPLALAACAAWLAGAGPGKAQSVTAAVPDLHSLLLACQAQALHAAAAVGGGQAAGQRNALLGARPGPEGAPLCVVLPTAVLVGLRTLGTAAAGGGGGEGDDPALWTSVLRVCAQAAGPSRGGSEGLGTLERREMARAVAAACSLPVVRRDPAARQAALEAVSALLVAAAAVNSAQLATVPGTGTATTTAATATRGERSAPQSRCADAGALTAAAAAAMVLVRSSRTDAADGVGTLIAVAGDIALPLARLGVALLARSPASLSASSLLSACASPAGAELTRLVTACLATCEAAAAAAAAAEAPGVGGGGAAQWVASWPAAVQDLSQWVASEVTEGGDGGGGDGDGGGGAPLAATPLLVCGLAHAVARRAESLGPCNGEGEEEEEQKENGPAGLSAGAGTVALLSAVQGRCATACAAAAQCAALLAAAPAELAGAAGTAEALAAVWPRSAGHALAGECGAWPADASAAARGPCLAHAPRSLPAAAADVTALVTAACPPGRSPATAAALLAHALGAAAAEGGAAAAAAAAAAMKAAGASVGSDKGEAQRASAACAGAAGVCAGALVALAATARGGAEAEAATRAAVALAAAVASGGEAQARGALSAMPEGLRASVMHDRSATPLPLVGLARRGLAARHSAGVALAALARHASTQLRAVVSAASESERGAVQGPLKVASQAQERETAAQGARDAAWSSVAGTGAAIGASSTASGAGASEAAGGGAAGGRKGGEKKAKKKGKEKGDGAGKGKKKKKKRKAQAGVE